MVRITRDFKHLQRNQTHIIGRYPMIGGSDDTIDWEEIKWGSFTNQFKRFKLKNKHSPINNLHEFASMIIKNPQNYTDKTLKRANFYNNVLHGGAVKTLFK